jgi:hypothetical protein
MATYEWKRGSRLKLDAQVVGEEIERMKDLGPITPARVVEEAKQPDSPFHNGFTWDVRQAAEERWADQARYILRSLVIVEVRGTETPTTRALVHLGPLGDDEDALDSQYHYLPDAVENDKVRTAILANAKRDALLFKHKYGVLQEVVEIILAIDRVLGS